MGVSLVLDGQIVQSMILVEPVTPDTFNNFLSIFMIIFLDNIYNLFLDNQIFVLEVNEMSLLRSIGHKKLTILQVS